MELHRFCSYSGGFVVPHWMEALESDQRKGEVFYYVKVRIRKVTTNLVYCTFVMQNPPFATQNNQYAIVVAKMGFFPFLVPPS